MLNSLQPRLRIAFQEGRGLGMIDIVTSQLGVASCLGDQDATFLLSTILNYGMGVKMNETLVCLPIEMCH